MLLVALLAGCGPLGSGETRCSTIYGTTTCKSGPPHPIVVQSSVAPVAAPTRLTHWCTTRESDGYGVCTQAPGTCEVFRGNRVGDDVWSDCERAPSAICALSGCFTTAATCAQAERARNRTGGDCVER